MSKTGRRVLIVEPAGNLWGSERVLLDFLCQTTNSTWQIAVCCPANTPIIPSLSRLGIRVFPAFIANLHLRPRAYRLLAAIRLLFVAARFRARLIYVNQAGATRIALFVGRLLRIPVVTHVRLLEDVEYIRSLGARATALPKIICISNFILGLFQTKNSIEATRLRMLYDPYSLRAGLPPNTEATEGIDAAGELPAICCVGRLTPIKGQDVLLRAISSLKSEGVSVRVLMVGAAGPGDEFDKALKHLAHDLGLADQLTWFGYQDDVLSCVKDCQLQVCPSHLEPLGRVLFEAWDAEILPIAWRGSGGGAEVISNSGGGLLYEEQSGESLARTIKLALEMGAEGRRKMIDRGRGWLHDHCDPEMFARSMFALWQEAMEPQRK